MEAPKIEIQQNKEANYRRLVRPSMMDRLKDAIVEQIVVHKRYRDGTLTARELAQELDTNVRYISAVVRVQFHTTYSAMVNKLRVEEAMSLLTDARYADLNVEDIGYKVGFLHRQSFHTAFLRLVGVTPNAYRTQFQNQLTSNKKTKQS